MSDLRYPVRLRSDWGDHRTLADDMRDNPPPPDPRPHVHFHEHDDLPRHAHEHTHLTGDTHPHSTRS